MSGPYEEMPAANPQRQETMGGMTRLNPMKPSYYGPVGMPRQPSGVVAPPGPQDGSSCIAEAVCELGDELVRSREILKKLEARLSPVLTPVPAANANNGHSGQASPAPMMGDLARVIRVNASGMGGLNMQLEDILRRLEI